LRNIQFINSFFLLWKEVPAKAVFGVGSYFFRSFAGTCTLLLFASGGRCRSVVFYFAIATPGASIFEIAWDRAQFKDKAALFAFYGSINT